MKFITYNLKTYSGSEIVARKVDLPDGGYVCPICGNPNHDYPPWSNGAMNGIPHFPANEDYASGSQDICSCGMEFGCEGYVGPSGKDGLNRLWMEWRLKWLRESDWSDDAIAQLSNLGFTRDEILAWKANDEMQHTGQSPQLQDERK